MYIVGNANKFTASIMTNIILLDCKYTYQTRNIRHARYSPIASRYPAMFFDAIL